MSNDPNEGSLPQITKSLHELVDIADIHTKKHLLTLMLGVGGTSPEMEQLHTFMSDNIKDHEMLKREIRILKYGVIALASAVLGITGVERVFSLLGGF